MEPPLKRPRLSIFANEAPSVELDTARLQNDRHLKGRFEAIFQKYERDFAGVGDEVDLSTGEVVVNNGHLAGLIEQADTRSEADEYKGDEPPTPGSNVSPRRRRLVTNGRSMLRAMTVAPDCDDAYFKHENADDVMDSIETIAENAALSEEDDASSGRSDDDLEDEDSEAEEDDAHEVQAEDGRRQSNQPIPIPVLQESPTHEPQPVAVDSDDDSLFEVPMERESSPDSLFEQPTEKSSTTPYEDVDPRQFFDSMGELDSEAIVARYGDKVGQEVLELIQRRDKAELHIEAAWRIPVQIQEQESTRDTSVAMPDPERSATAISRASSTPKKGASLWTAPKRSRLELHQDRTMTVIRAESEDPLQEGFVDSGPVEVRVAEVSLDRAVRLLNRGMCPYCKKQFFSLPRAQGHLRAILEKTNGDSQNDPHNLARIEELLSAMDEDVEEDHEGATEESNNAVDATAAGILQSVENKRPDRNRPSKSVKGAEESDDDLFMDAADTDDNYEGLPWAEEDSPTLHTSSFPIPEQLTAPTPSAVTRIMVEDSDEADHEPEARPQPGRGRFMRQQHRTSSHHDASLKASVRRSPESPDVARHENGSDSHHSHNSRPEAEPSRLPLRPRKAKKVIKYCFKNKQSGKLRLSVPKRKQRPPARPPACPLPRSPARSPAHSPDCPPSTENPYKCAVCRKRYRNPNGLHYHKLHAPSCYPDLQVNNDQPAPSVIPAPSSGIVIAISTKRPDASIADSPSAIGTGSADNGNDRAIGGSTKTRHRSSAAIAVRAQNLAEIYADFQSTSHRQEKANDEQRQTSDSDSADSSAQANTENPEPVYHFTVADYRSLVLHTKLPVDPLRGMGSQDDEWTEFEDILLQDLSLNPQTLMETIRPRLPARSQFEIGNRLASYFLAESRTASRPVESETEPYYTDRGRIKKGNDRRILTYADVAVSAGDDVQMYAPKDIMKPAEPLKRRNCRDLSPSGVWRGCGKVSSQRCDLTRHWKETLRACFEKDFVPWT